MSTDALTSSALNILLVEDNPDDAALLERHLRKHGFNSVLTTVDNVAAMRASLACAPRIDVVLADYNLPNFSGPEALQLLKASGLDIPFIMLSGAVSEQTAVDSMRAGAHDYVSKENLTRLVPALERELKEASGRRNKILAEVALQASEDRFHHLVDAMPMGLLLNDRQGRILFANLSIARLLGRSLANLHGSNIDGICEAILAAQLTAEPNAPTFEATCVTSAATPLEVLIGVALLNPEAPADEQQFAAFIADLSLQKKSQRALRQTEKLAVAGRLAASIAHEINNPLEAITNCLYLTASANLPPDARGYVELAQTELNRVSQITVQTLRFFRGSARPEPTVVEELIETVLALLEARLQRANIRVERRFRAHIDVIAQGGEIRQVLANLIGNAMDALPEGGRLILRTAEASDWKTGTRGVAITVADTGSGMSAAVQAQIWEPFFSTKGITGTGLGLWISQEIIGKHHGTLHVRSRSGSGTAFRLFLPASTAPQA